MLKSAGHDHWAEPMRSIDPAGRRPTRFSPSPALALLLGALSLFAAAPAQAQAPDGVTNLTATPRFGGLHIAWTNPSGAGSDVTEVNLRYREQGADTWRRDTAVDGSMTDFYMLGLTPGTTYEVEVRLFWIDTASYSSWASTTGTPPMFRTVSLSVLSDSVREGSSVAVRATFSHPASSDLTIPVTLTAGTADAGDYGSLSGITIASGRTSGTGTIPTADDADTDDETFTVALGALPSTVRAGSPSSVTVTIRDDDLLPSVRLSVSPNPVEDGSAVTVTATLSATLSSDVSIPVTATLGTAEETDVGGWFRMTRRIAIAAGKMSGEFRISTDDDADTDDETFMVALGALPFSVQAGSPSSVTVAISDGGVETPRPKHSLKVSLSATPNPVPEGSNVVVTATLNGQRTNADRSAHLTIPLTITRGTSEQGDHGTLAGILISDMTRSATGVITTTKDSDADDETFTVALDSNNLPSGVAAGTPASITVTITEAALQQGGGGEDPEPQESLTASFEQVPSEHKGRGAFSLLVRLSETVGNFSRSPRPSSFEVTRGRVQSVEQVDAGLWRVRVKPSSWRTVGVTLAGGRDCDTEGAVCTPDGRALSNTVSATVQGLAGLKVAGGLAREGKDEAIDFSVTLSRAASGTVTVDYATEDETATAGSDYTATSGTLTFAAGETEKTVRVAILDDLIDEGREIFRLKLSNASGARIADGKAAGRIGNTDPGQAAWLSRFGRAVATGVVDALGDRIDRRAQVRSRSGDADLSLLHSFVLSAAGGHGGAGMGYGGAGYRADFGMGYANATPGFSNSVPGHHRGVGLGSGALGGAPGGGPMLGNSMPMGPVGAGPDMGLPSGSLYVPGGDGNRWTGWARTSVGHFSSAGPGAPVALGGQMRMGIFGTDYQMGRMLAGVAIAHGRGTGNLTRAGLDRAYSAHSTLTSVHPYVAFDLSEDLTVWGQGGWGRGEMALAESFVRDEGLEQAGAHRTGNGLTMMAAGVRGGLPEMGGFQLAVKSDAFLVRTVSDALSSLGGGNLAAAEAGVSRVRAALEGSRELRFARGRSITPSVELGVRQDGGDAETGTGLDTGFGVVYADPNFGLMVDATLSLLVAHQDSRYEEWGFTGSVRFDPGLAGRGLSLTMTPSFGMASQGADRLWAMQDMGGLVPHGALPLDMGGQFAADVGYGMAGPGGRGTGTPYAGLTQSAVGYQAMRYGWRWAVDQRFNVGVEGARQAGFGGTFDGGYGAVGLGRSGDAAHSVQVRGGVSF